MRGRSRTAHVENKKDCLSGWERPKKIGTRKKRTRIEQQLREMHASGALMGGGCSYGLNVHCRPLGRRFAGQRKDGAIKAVVPLSKSLSRKGKVRCLGRGRSLVGGGGGGRPPLLKELASADKDIKLLLLQSDCTDQLDNLLNNAFFQTRLGDNGTSPSALNKERTGQRSQGRQRDTSLAIFKQRNNKGEHEEGGILTGIIEGTCATSHNKRKKRD